MTFRERMALGLTPVLLRLAIAVTFLWAGVMKLSPNDFDSGQAATLANMGIIAPASSPPAESLPSAESIDGSQARAAGAILILAQDESSAPPAAEPPAEQPGASPPVTPEQTAPPAKRFTEADFPTGATARGLYGVSLAVHHSAKPASEGGGLMPEWTGRGAWPRALGWAVALTEAVGGACVFVGLLTRFWALGFAVVMLTAIWLTGIGPIVVHDKPAFLWVFPELHFRGEGAGASFSAWNTLLFQFTLLMTSLALLFTGAGRVSLDRALFGRPGEAPDGARGEPRSNTDPD